MLKATGEEGNQLLSQLCDLVISTGKRVLSLIFTKKKVKFSTVATTGGSDSLILNVFYTPVIRQMVIWKKFFWFLSLVEEQQMLFLLFISCIKRTELSKRNFMFALLNLKKLLTLFPEQCSGELL